MLAQIVGEDSNMIIVISKDNINHNPEHQKAFIQQFVETYVTGIKLKNVETFRQCPVCSKGY